MNLEPKISVAVVNGFTFLDRLRWDAFNEVRTPVVVVPFRMEGGIVFTLEISMKLEKRI